MFGFITRLVREGFSDPLQACREARPLLNELATELDAITVRVNQHQTSAIDEITGFYRAIATVLDSGVIPQVITELSIKGGHEALVRQLDRLNLQLSYDARRPYPVNQAHLGQPITDADIYLGSFEGEWMMNVQDIKTKRHDHSLFFCMNQEAAKLMEAHVGPTLITIHEFERVMVAVD